MKEKKEWKKEIDLFLNNKIPEGRKLLYRFSGLSHCKRTDFVKYLMKEKSISYSSANRLIRDWIYLDIIFSNGLQRRMKLCLEKFE